MTRGHRVWRTETPLVLLRSALKTEDQSPCRIIQAEIEIKSWIAGLPAVDRVRPTHCPVCDAPSRPVGGRLGIRGHGLRERQIRGPLEPGGPPVLVTVLCRRFRCLSCRSILIVAPRGVLPRRAYHAAAIAWILARIGLEGATTTAVRREVCPFKIIGPSAIERWLAPIRWLIALRKGLLFAGLGRPKRRRHAKASRRSHRDAARRARACCHRPQRIPAHRLARRRSRFVMAIPDRPSTQKGATMQDRAVFRAALA